MLTNADSSVNAIRTWLAGQLHRSDVPPWLWDELTQGGVIELSRADILREARRRIRSIRRDTDGQVVNRPEGVNVDDLLNQAESERAWAFSEYIAGLAAADPDLQKFRSSHLDGRVLSHEERTQFLASEALCYLSAGDLRSKNIPLWGHTLLALDRKNGPARYESKSGGAIVMFRQETHIEVSWDGRTETFDTWMETSPGAEDLPKLDLPVGGGWFPYRVWDRSVFNELLKVRNRLMEAYPWDGIEATEYVLQGGVPFIPPIHVAPVQMRVGAFGHAKLEVTIEPWISAQTVALFYKHLRSASYAGRSRAMGARNLALFRFVTSHAQPGMEIPSFELLLTLWNEAHPEWQYGSARMLARDYRRAGKVIVFPRYQIGARAKGRAERSVPGGRKE